MTRIRAIGFDLDGTLFDHQGSANTGVTVFLKTLGLEPSDEALKLWFGAEEEAFEEWRAGRISFQEQRRQRLRIVLPALGFDVEDKPPGLDQLFERYLVEYRAAWAAFQDTARVLDQLRSERFRLGLLTNGNAQQQLDKLKRIGILDAFDTVCISEEIGVQKPDPRAFEMLAGRLGCSLDECLFIGDNPDQDIAGAIGAGMRAALVERSRVGAPDLKSVIRFALASD